MPLVDSSRFSITVCVLLLFARTVTAETAGSPWKSTVVESMPVVGSSSQPVASFDSEADAEFRLQSTPTAQFDNRFQDQVWMVSSRRLGSRNCSVNSLDVRQRMADGTWLNSSAPTFFAPDPDNIRRPVVVFIHGNRWSFDKAIRRGLQTYEQTIMPWHDAPAMRFVIWSWPADQIAGPIRDVRIKAHCADEHAFHLARFLQQLEPGTPVSLIGFSFGGRVALGALHLVGGGFIDGCGLPASGLPVSQVNLTLAVPAIRNDCLVTTRCRAWSQINHLDLLYNSRDTYLSLYRLTRFDNRTPALGYTGIAGLNRLPNQQSRVHQFNAARFVGVEHDYLEYITDNRIEANLRKHLLIGLPQ